MALAHRQLGRAYREEGPDQVDRAEKHLGIATGMLEEMGASFEEALTMAETGLLWEGLGELGEAAALYSRAEDLLAPLDAPGRLAGLRARISAVVGRSR
jgi:predicted translin family RNA/ssDNA-binding protein